MMISTKGRYALRFLADVAEHQGSGFVPLKDVAARQEISEKYLEIVVKELVKGGLLDTLRGKGGGYRLNSLPEEYSVKAIIERMEGPLAPVACLEPGQGAKNLYLSQPSLSSAVRDLEEEIGFELFHRSNRGVTITAEGEEFLNYARQVCQQYALLEDRFVAGRSRKKFSVSTQHYTFAINAFVEMVRKVGMEEYEFSILETRTYECVENVRNYKSELGILYLDDFNEKYLTKLFEENNLEFHPLRDCSTCVYLWGEHPLAHRDQLTMADLEPYPCIAFELGKQNSLFLSEEVMSTYQYRQLIRVDDRATVLNLMKGLNGYTLCSGIICRPLNGSEYTTIPLAEGGVMHIGYVQRWGSPLSRLGELYLSEVRKSILL